MAVTTGFKQQCPSCEAMVPIKDASLVGKKIDCPKCKYRFVVESPADDAGDDEEEAAKPAKPAKAPKASSKGKPLPRRDEDDEDEADESPKKKKGGSNSTMLIGGIGGLVVALIAIAYFAGIFGGDSSTTSTTKPSTSTGTSGPKPSTASTTSTSTTSTSSSSAGDAATTTSTLTNSAAPPTGIDADPTNLMPNETQLIYQLNMEKFYRTPVGERLFAPETRTKNFFIENIGISPENIKTVVTGAHAFFGWSFTAVRTSTPMDPKKVLDSLGLENKPIAVDKLKYYLIRSNPLLDSIGAYLRDNFELLNFKLFNGVPDRKMTAHIMDDYTLIIADESAMVQFLKFDRKPGALSIYNGSGAPAENAGGAPAGGGGGPSTGRVTRGGGKGPAPKDGAPADNTPNNDDQNKEKKPVYSSNPTYLTVDPGLKLMMNRLDDTQKDSVMFAAFKYADMLGPLSSMRDRLTRGADDTAGAGLLFKLPIFGFMVKTIDSKKLSLLAQLEVSDVFKDTEVQKATEFFNTAWKPLIIDLFEDLFGIPIGNRAPGGRPGGPGPGPRGGGRSSNPQDENPPVIPLQGRPGRVTPGAAGGGGPGGTTNSESSVSFSSSGRVISLNVEIDWAKSFDTRIIGIIEAHVDQERSKAVLLAGRAHWTAMQKPLKNFEKDNMLPKGAWPRKTNPNRFNVPIPAEQRVSWMAELLPGLGYDNLSREIFRELPWNHESNLRCAVRWIPEFLSPAQPSQTWRTELPSIRNHELGATHFIGLSGIGLNAAEYPDTPEYAKKLGLFGYDRQTKFSDITDGTSNTIFVMQVSPNIPRPWIRGGGTTVQGVPEEDSFSPFVVVQPDGRFGNYAMMADGSVRFIKSNIAPEVFKALVTYKGGEKLEDVNLVAAKEDPKAIEGQARTIRVAGESLISAWQQHEIKEAFLKVLTPGGIQSEDIKDQREFVIESVYCCPSIGNPIYSIHVAKSDFPLRVASDNQADLDTIIENMQKKNLHPENVQKKKVGAKNCRRFEVQRANGRFADQMFISNDKVVMMEVQLSSVKQADIDKFFDSVILNEPKVSIGWQKFNLEQSGLKVTVEMPGPPEQISSAADIFNKTFQYRDRFQKETPEFELSVQSGTEYPPADYDGKKADAFIENLKVRPGIEILTIAIPITTNDFAGRMFKMRQTLKEKGKDGAEGKEKIILSAVRIYMLNGSLVMVRVRYSDKASEADVKRYLESVKLEKAN